jgi:Histidine kinase
MFKILLFCLFLLYLPSSGQTATTTKDSSQIIIEKFRTHILRKNKIWPTYENIEIPTVPGLLSIYFKEKIDSSNADFICVIVEPMSLRDTLRLGSQSSLHFNNLAGGDYSLTFINLKNGHSKILTFSIANELWKRWWFIPLVFLTSLSVLALFFYFVFLIKSREQNRLQKLKYQLEIKALKAQMNPHFIFNSMNTIDAYILNKRFVEASDFLQKFSKLIRRILENSDFSTVSLQNEIETLKLYIELEQERFSNSFTYTFNIGSDISLHDYQIPPLLLQPFIENSILHGIRYLKTNDGHLDINIAKESDSLNIRIIDNGVGRTAANKINIERPKSHNSMGTRITLDRILNYQAQFGKEIEPQILDLAKGTEIRIILPINIKDESI